MNAATPTIVVPSHLTVVFMFARLLERLERSGDVVHARQYRFVVRQLAREMAAVVPDERLHALLGVFPAAAQLFENLHYAQVGLCHQPQDAADTARQQALYVIERARRGARAPRRRSLAQRR